MFAIQITVLVITITQAWSYISSKEANTIDNIINDVNMRNTDNSNIINTKSLTTSNIQILQTNTKILPEDYPSRVITNLTILQSCLISLTQEA